MTTLVLALANILLVGTISSIFLYVKRGVSDLKVMLLGMNITLLCCIIAGAPNSHFGGIEYLIVLFGLFFFNCWSWKNE